MWVQARASNDGEVVEASISTSGGSGGGSGAVQTEEILFNQSMTKIQIAEGAGAGAGAGAGGKVTSLCKVDADKSTSKEVPLGPEGALVTVTERCYWDSSSNAALVINLLDVSGEREITFYRFVDNSKKSDGSGTGGDGDDTSTDRMSAVSSKVYNVLRVRRVEKDLRTMSVLESEKLFIRKKGKGATTV